MPVKFFDFLISELEVIVSNFLISPIDSRWCDISGPLAHFSTRGGNPRVFASLQTGKKSERGEKGERVYAVTELVVARGPAS